MRLIRSAGGRRLVTVLLTLSLLALSHQPVGASHESGEAIGAIALVAVLGGAILAAWLIMRDDDDPPDPSTTDSPTASRSTPWRPSPGMAKGAFEKQFGRSVRFPGASAFTHATGDDPTPVGDDLRRAVRAIRGDYTRLWIADEELKRLVPTNARPLQPASCAASLAAVTCRVHPTMGGFPFAHLA